MVNLLYGFLLFTFVHILVWISTNAQFSDFFKDYNTLFMSAVLAVPISIFAYYGSRFMFAESGSAWTIRFLASSIGYVIFPIMTWYFLGESMFTVKTILCIILAVCIILIQVFM